MTNQRVALLLLLSVLTWSGCGRTGTDSPEPSKAKAAASPSSNQLTNVRAQKAVQAWISQTKESGSVSVIGIQEMPQQNSARADLQFTNLQFTEPYYGKRNFSGKGSAVFSHYSDGRWVLTNITTDNGLDSIVATANIAVD